MDWNDETPSENQTHAVISKEFNNWNVTIMWMVASGIILFALTYRKFNSAIQLCKPESDWIIHK